MTDDPEIAARRRRLVYGRRKGPKLSEHQSSLFTTLLPKLALEIRDGAEPRSYFSAPVEDVWLEIGFGAGEHLLWQAEHHPNVGLIGAEPYEGGVAKILSRMDTSPPGTENIKIHMGDARDILFALPDASLGRVFILFPDPWPKTRHHKRRFIQTEMLGHLSRVMKPSAELRFASDDAPLVEYTLERLTAHPAFTWTATRAESWKSRPADWPPTRYEAKQLHGIPAFLEFRRV
ncbi:MAG TPA: tRNA (guanine(46)-N(7))-methyltransferase TrmB [Rhizomicrobium sp.]|jgi:tRNA (guanine-N7-)-methyltransferase